MSALLAALGCSVMMVVVVAAFAWQALRGRRSNEDEANEVEALRAEISEFGQRRPDASDDKSPERR